MRALLEHPGFGKSYRLADETNFFVGAVLRIVRFGYLDSNRCLDRQGYEIEVVEMTECGMIRYRYGGSASRELASVPLKNLLRGIDSACLVRIVSMKEPSENRPRAEVLPFSRAA